MIFDDQSIEMSDTFCQMQQERTTGARGQIAFVDDNEASITLFKGAADLSTFANEAGHLFFHDLERMVKSGKAPQEVIDDYSTLKAWTAANRETYYNNHLRGRFGGKMYDQLTAEERASADNVAEQELLDEGWLTYLRKGKAPSAELRGVFSRFRNWLVSIYKALSGQGFQPINDDVRAVFDRMLASKEEVAEMEQEHAATEEERQAIDLVGEAMLSEAEKKRLRDARRKAKSRDAIARHCFGSLFSERIWPVKFMAMSLTHSNSAGASFPSRIELTLTNRTVPQTGMTAVAMAVVRKMPGSLGSML